MPTTRRDARFLRRMLALMLLGCALLMLGVLLEPFADD